MRLATRARAVAVTLTVASLVIGILASSSPAFADPGGSKLSKEDRQRVAEATANGGSVTLLFATVEPQTSSVAAQLQALGATVRRQDGDVGYIRADVPSDKVDAASKIAGVLAVEVDQVFEIPVPDLGDGDTPEQLPPGPTTGTENPYMPTRDIGAPQFVAANPTWDGRGVTIGILDTGVDVGHPALQTTTTGERKIVDWVSYTDPATDGDPSWINMNRVVTVVGGSFTVDGKTWTGAPDGSWYFGTFTESDNLFQRTNGTAAPEYRISACSNRPGGGGDLNRNGKCDEVFAFLWDGFQNGYVWRDADADGDFSDDVGMREYKKDFAVGEYGDDNPATPIRESVPFVTQIDAVAGFVSLGIVSGAHGTHVAGIAAGGTLYGSATGAAPGAKIVSIRVCLFTSGCTAHALIEGMIYATKDANVDTVNMSIGGLPSLNDGNNARAILYNRLTDKWGAQLFFSAGNSGPGVNTVGDPSVATKVMSVGAYWHKDSVFANYGNVVPGPEALHDFSSRGPREDGGFKPDIIAPGNATSSVPTWQGGQCLSTPNCGPGLGMFNGTSMAAPMATGAAALLLSAAIPTETGHKPEQMRQAMRSSARFLSNELAHEQGFGLINVGAAWDLLKTNIKTAEVSSSVATNTKLSGFLATPGFGSGIYDREGVHPGAAPYTRTYTFTRTDGGGGTFDLSWRGNDGTFSTTATSIAFDKKGSATVDVTITPGAPGVHSALLLVDDPKTVGVDYATMNTVIVSIPLNAANSYKASVDASASKFQAGDPKIFFSVPAGTTAMRMTITILNTGRVNATPVHPFGIPLTGTGFVGTGTPGASASLVITTGPTDGVWEVASAASRAAIPDTSSYRITFEAYKVTLDPALWINDPTVIGTPYTRSFTATNEFAATTTVQTTTGFASVRSVNATITASGPQQTYDINVPSGTSSMNVAIGAASDPGADLDLFLFNCTTGTCVLVASGLTSSANESLTVANPAAGAWKAVVDPFAVPSGSTTYVYNDSFTSATNAYGGLTTPSNAPTNRASGASWSFNVTGTANSAAGEGRFLRGTIAVRLGSSTGPTLGSATAFFVNVTP